MTQKFVISKPVLIQVPTKQEHHREIREISELRKAVYRSKDLSESARQKLLKMLDDRLPRNHKLDRTKALEVRAFAKRQIGLSENKADEWAAEVYGVDPWTIKRWRRKK
jgi:hypothetical protein